MTRPEAVLVSVEAFARLTGAAPGEVERLLRAGVLKRAAPGRIALVEGTRAFIAHTRASARDATAAAAAADAKAARAEASELSVSIQSRELVPDHEADAALLAVCGAVLEATAGLSARTTRDLRVRAVVEATIRAAQEGLADDLAALSGDPFPTPATRPGARTKGPQA